MTTESIAFPNLGITFHDVGRGISIGSFNIAFYGIIIAIGMLFAMLLAEYNARRDGYPKDTFVDIGIVGIICGIIGARAYYCIFAWDAYKDNILGVLDIRSGGLALYGGVIGGIIGGYLMARRKGIKFFPAADIAVQSILIGQIFGRWGNFFNREAFGDYSDGLFAMAIPVDAVRSTSDITGKMSENLLNIDGVSCITVHPTFLYESMWNLCVFILIFLIGRRAHKKGLLFMLYIFFYGIGRFFIESLRTDQLKIGHTNIPVSMVVAGTCVVVALIWFIKKYLIDKKRA